MERLYRAGAHVLYLDECTFKARGYQQYAWSRPCENIEVFDRTKAQPCIAVIAAVCTCHGVWAWAMRPYSYNKEAYVDFLHQCKERWDQEYGEGGSEKMVIFLDNLQVHRSRVAQRAYRKLRIRPIFNVGYSPEYNDGIERFWGQVKTVFRPRLLQ